MLALLVGGLTEVSRQSQGYDANSNRSLAAQGAVVAEQSNATASQVRSLINDMQTQTRQGLQAALDSAVQQTADEAARSNLAASANPLGSVAVDFTDGLRRTGPVRGRTARRGRRIPRHATHSPRRFAF